MEGELWDIEMVRKSRFAPLPKQLVEPLRKMVEARRSMHDRAGANGEASVGLSVVPESDSGFT